MGVEVLAILLSFTAAAVLLMFVGRVVRLLLKLAFVVALAWFLYAKVWPAIEKARGEKPRSFPVAAHVEPGH